MTSGTCISSVARGVLRGLEHPLCPGHKAYVKLLTDSYLPWQRHRLCKQKLKFKVRMLEVWSHFGACAYLSTVAQVLSCGIYINKRRCELNIAWHGHLSPVTDAA